MSSVTITTDDSFDLPAWWDSATTVSISYIGGSWYGAKSTVTTDSNGLTVANALFIPWRSVTVMELH